MKRPPNLDPPRRKRVLSGEDRELWENFTKSAKPLRKTRRANATEAPVAEPSSPASSAPSSAARPPQIELPKAPARAPKSPPPLAPLGRREKSHLARGKKDIDARLDLHGMTQARAHRRLLNFLHDASEDGCTFVLVITGKGRTAEPGAERGLLRRMVPEWLGLPEFRSVVVGFETAHVGHGGDGALYVRIRRAR
ncbi:MAG: Smr/MutS family protein [Afipia sp.]|nr:Smr/MutS family protein [Afipia sp.]